MGAQRLRLLVASTVTAALLATLEIFSEALKEVRELKPNTPSGIRLGMKQLQGYVDHMNSITPGGGWRGVLDTYQP